MIRQTFAAIIIGFCTLNQINSQTHNPDIVEKLSMSLVYQLGFINMPSGEILFQSSKTDNGNGKELLLEAKGNTLKSFDFFFTYSSSLQTCIDIKTSRLNFSERKVNHNGNLFEESYLFDTNRKKAFSKCVNDKHICKYDTLQLINSFHDFLSAFYDLRFQNYTEMKAGQNKTLTILLENKFYPLNTTYLGIEKITLPDGRNFVCYKLKIQVIEGSVFKSDNIINAWISADNKRLPVKLYAGILVGSLNAYLINSNSINESLTQNK